MRFQDVHQEENVADWRDRQQQERCDCERPPLAREERVEAILSVRIRGTTPTATRPIRCEIPRFMRSLK
jgi:hypothetical protein